MDDGAGDGRSGVDRVVTLLAERLELTRRQAEIAFLLVIQEKTVAETARALSLDVSTVKDHVERLSRRLGVSSRVGLAKQVCPVLRGDLDEEAMRQDGRLSLRFLRRRLGLPPRLAELARLIWEGKTTRQIARAMSLSLATAKHYRDRCYRKLGISSAVGLVLRVYTESTRGWVPSAEPIA